MNTPRDDTGIPVSAAAGLQDMVAEPPHVSDYELAHKVTMLLQWSDVVPARGIGAEISDGCVTLSGMVRSTADAEEIEQGVRHISGVRDVVNRIEIGAPLLDPEEIRTAVTEALRHLADVEAKGIEIGIDGATIILRGLVESASAQQAVLEAVRGVAGVEHVYDHLTIDTIERAAPQFF
jgi:osmotically-inducible protein OsmY